MNYYDIVIVGGGSAGMAAALAAYQSGVKSILIIERNDTLGGILTQCIHNGFGLHRMHRELTGPEYAAVFADEVKKCGIAVLYNSFVTDLSAGRVLTVSSPAGTEKIQGGAVILATGCRERSRGALSIPGTRPAGVYAAGTAQKLLNQMGCLVGKKAVILGSGDIGLIMARRLTLEGIAVAAVCEVLPYSGGLKRNIVQCLDDFGIPLYLSTTVTEIHGKDRLCGVTIAQVDENRTPIEGTSRYIECDTLLLSVGLIPENELAENAGIRMDPKTHGTEVSDNRETSLPGVFACGNALHVHDLVDYVSDEGELAGKSAAAFVQSGGSRAETVRVLPCGGVRYVIPQRIRKGGQKAELLFRVSRPMQDVTFTVSQGERVLLQKRKASAAPGEMEKLELITGITGDITVNAEEMK